MRVGELRQYLNEQLIPDDVEIRFWLNKYAGGGHMVFMLNNKASGLDPPIIGPGRFIRLCENEEFGTKVNKTISKTARKLSTTPR